MPSPPDASLNELMDATLSWQSSDSDSMNGNSGDSTGDNTTAPSSYPGSQDAENSPGDVGEISPSSSAEDYLSHYPYDMWEMNATPPHNPPYNPSADDTWHDNSTSQNQSSFNDAPIFHKGSYVHFPD